eukprot:CAMPEP_0197045128 /NCGR_PEP_ID=MMETSP1384-20130603/21060_1 /TAXON_ID=29189 /ORGANISM="Ammonia sp." /LENGTH=183 /DNA_ID=CAMNT_0042476695 /DNA_START=40 /DNA_END=591 /DNA_ORIENTATION=-
MGDWNNIDIAKWTPEHVKRFISAQCEAAQLSEEQAEEINQVVVRDGISGPILMSNLDTIPQLLGPAVANIPAPMIRGFKQAITNQRRKAQEQGVAGVEVGGNYAASTDYILYFKEGLKQTPISVTADITLAKAKEFFLEKEAGNSDFRLQDGRKGLNINKTLRELGLTSNPCTVNIVGRNNGG